MNIKNKMKKKIKLNRNTQMKITMNKMINNKKK